ncbi:OsmC family protein [Candidatus Bathyarchaeota archaeon]|nr:OsmC family protein [Candidatus Bathyarchaeota archaeon]
MSLTVKYLEGTKFEVTCRSHSITTDQPKSENGADQGMTPVELLNASLAACASYYAMIFLKRRFADLKGLEVRSSWKYSEDPHRVGVIQLEIIFPHSLTEPERKGLLRSVEHCTVENTLKHPPKIRINVRD